MCGRYALSFRVVEVRQRMLQAGMPVDEAPEDDEVRQSYNVAPGYNELVYRADVPDWGDGSRSHGEGGADNPEAEVTKNVENTATTQKATEVNAGSKEARYKLQSMKWGLIPFWTKRKPDYGSMLRTINCRDDSLIEDRGMWTTMKQRKRCIVLCQGFYEWLKKNDGKEKIPHFVKRKDDQLMCFAGLWDVAKYEGEDKKFYTYTIITTSSNAQLSFLHDRMPVILENGSTDMRTWLDPGRSTWSAELQALLRPYQGELDVYPVSKDVGKVGNNSPTFIVPVSSAENKNNIANYFANAKGGAKKEDEESKIHKEEESVSAEALEAKLVPGETRETQADNDGTEDHAPLPPSPPDAQAPRVKREQSEIGSEEASPPPKKHQKTSEEPPAKGISPAKIASTKKTRSATSNGTGNSPMKRRRGVGKAPAGSQEISRFFSK